MSFARGLPVRLAAALALPALGAAACAHIEPPPGGEEDTTAPSLVAVRPDSLQARPGFRGPAVFVFDEGLSGQGVEEAVSVSPRTSPVEVSKRGDEIRVDLRRGWRDGLVYHVRLEPQVRDLFGNAIEAPARIVFSTGPEIPDTRAAGTVIDRVTALPAEGVRVEAIRAADSLVYDVRTDAQGRFLFDRIPEGDYLLRAFDDANRNRALELFEPRDSTPVRIAGGESPEVALRLLLPDSTPPVLGAAEAEGPVVELTFDDHLDPEQELDAIDVSLVGPDGRAVRLTERWLGEAGDSAATADTTGLPGAVDTAGAPRAPRPVPRARPAPADTVPGDTAGGAPPVPTGPVPSQTLTVRPAAPLLPDAEYRVVVRDARNLNGLAGGGEAEFETPEPPPPAEPEAPADSVPSPPAPAEPQPPPDTSAAGGREPRTPE